MNVQDYINHIDDMLTRYDDMSLYVFNIEMEVVYDVIRSITNSMNIKFDLDKLNASLNSKQKIGPEKICVFFNEKDHRQFVLLSCHKMTYIYKIVVRCLQKDSEKIIPSFEPWRSEFFENVGGFKGKAEDIYREEPGYCYHNGKKVSDDPVRGTLRFNGLIKD